MIPVPLAALPGNLHRLFWRLLLISFTLVSLALGQGQVTEQVTVRDDLRMVIPVSSAFIPSQSTRDVVVSGKASLTECAVHCLGEPTCQAVAVYSDRCSMHDESSTRINLHPGTHDPGQWVSEYDEHREGGVVCSNVSRIDHYCMPHGLPCVN